MQSKCKAMQSNFIRLVFVLILYNYLIINEAVALFRYAVFTKDRCQKLMPLQHHHFYIRKHYFL